ncbi:MULTISPECIES: hypothetical protein [Streptomyces]|uniref:Uncharacterized protein n=2 Tax=Streptomyces TaxID=1883 RepID=A0ABU4K276_9ACTN|nr:hypothetical protein [Streptomyces roseolus]MDX2291649.1 hypothetical protein [Streptomyces roseolus]
MPDEDNASRPGERTRWYAGQLVAPADLTQWNHWVIDRRRRHNRLLHGWGIVCGVDVSPARTPEGSAIPGTVDIAPGALLAPQGDEIAVDEPVRVDARSLAPAGSGGALDPDHTYFLVIRYHEEPTGAVQTVGSENEDACEYSRIREGYELGLLDALPEIYTMPPPTGPAGGRPCPLVTSEAWVALAALKFPPTGVVAVDTSPRRYAPLPQTPTSGPELLHLTLTPNLVWINENAFREWSYENGRAQTRKKTDSETSAASSGTATTEGMMSVSLPHGSLVKRFTVTGLPVADRSLTIRLLRAPLLDAGHDAEENLVAEVLVPAQEPGASPFTLHGDAPGDDRAQVQTDKYRYFLLATAKKTTGNALNGQAYLHSFQISYVPPAR